MLRRSFKVLDREYQWALSKINTAYGKSHHIHMKSGEGSWLVDTEGKRYLDFSSGIGVTNLGHCHPRLVKVVQNQAAQLWHGQSFFGITKAMTDMLHELETVFPKELSVFSFMNSGAEAVESALKVARCARPGRTNTVVVRGGYHGRTVASAALTTSKAVYAKGMRPLMPGVVVVPFPYTSQLHCDPKEDMSKVVATCLSQMEDILHQVADATEVNMMLIEPVMGEGGYVPAPAAFLQGARDFCKKHDIIFALDEVQTGWGRTGTHFAFQQSGVVPDIVVFAKGIANGLPLSGIATRKELADKSLPGSQGGTYSGNALACASAAEVIKIMKEEGILNNVVARSHQLKDGLLRITRELHAKVCEIRGRGLMVAMQFDRDAPKGAANQFVEECGKRGLIVMTAGIYETVRVIPPLNVSAGEINEALTIMKESLEAIKDISHPAGTVVDVSPCCVKPCLTYGYKREEDCCRTILKWETESVSVCQEAS